MRPRTHKVVRLLIVDDSLIARTVLTRLVEREEGLEVVAVATSAENAIQTLSSVSVDIVLLDLEMPGMGGLEALPLIISASHDARIIIVSSLTVEGAEHTLRALALGASDTVAKPSGGRITGSYAEALVEKIRALGDATFQPKLHVAKTIKPVPPMRRLADAAPAVLAVGASTGGIHALGELFKGLPPHLGIPIIVTQHLPPAFMPAFARQMALSSCYQAVIAEEGMILQPNRIHIAPGEAHLRVVRNNSGQLIVKLDDTPEPNGCMPSVDPMFASLAETLGSQACGVVLTGMGRDGLKGATRIVEAGGSIMVQDEKSSAVWGMPRAVADAGLASAILPPGEIAHRIIAQVRGTSCN